MSQISRLKDAEISNGNLINADDIDAELNQLIAESNSQDTRLTDIESNAVTLAGVKTFSSNPKVNGIDERTAASGVTIDSVRCKDGMLKVSGTPTEGGEVGYASNRLKYHNGTSVITLPDYGFISTVETRSSNTILAASDLGKVLVCTSTFTQTLTTAATLTSGWFVHIRNDGTGVITLDPNSSETIDGFTTMNMYPGEALTIVCDGSNFKTLGRKLGPILITSGTASNVATVDITSGITSEFDHYQLKVWDLVPATNDTNLSMRVTTNGGSSWASGASDYTWQAQSSSGWDSTGNLGDSYLGLNYQGSSDGKLSNGANATCNFDLTFNNPAGIARYKGFSATGSIYNAAGRGAALNAGGIYVGGTSAINGLRFFMSSGNISMNYALYGWRKS